ncbi:hypothetical protein GGX14DRAFT_604857 [Mycena pura]|uniref:HNH nuclease domain-containing protein n=1 Tax=Mycena pura TaxID=153505 RepID=A0AAD6YGV6_9AGAR|nr:hypothetical protein GGX14DRAFT_604857 [Mycena pura]
MPPLNPPATLRVKSNPTPLLERTGSVYVYHPGYDPPKLLLDLTVYPPSPDHDSEAASSGGIPLTLVCYACEIVANNVAGRLTEFEDENTIIVDMEVQDTLLHGNALLPPGEYRYHATSDDEKPYAKCTRFKAWRPPLLLPRAWALYIQKDGPPPGGSNVSTISSAAKRDDGRCAVTGDSTRLHSSHVVPEHEEPWFDLHRLGVKAGDAYNYINSINNLVTLRADLNAAAFDEGHLIIFPYAGNLATFFLTPDMRDLAHMKQDANIIPVPEQLKDEEDEGVGIRKRRRARDDDHDITLQSDSDHSPLRTDHDTSPMEDTYQYRDADIAELEAMDAELEKAGASRASAHRCACCPCLQDLPPPHLTLRSRRPHAVHDDANAGTAHLAPGLSFSLLTPHLALGDSDLAFAEDAAALRRAASRMLSAS